jgi:hypothetical protein
MLPRVSHRRHPTALAGAQTACCVGARAQFRLASSQVMQLQIRQQHRLPPLIPTPPILTRIRRMMRHFGNGRRETAGTHHVGRGVASIPSPLERWPARPTPEGDFFSGVARAPCGFRLIARRNTSGRASLWPRRQRMHPVRKMAGPQHHERCVPRGEASRRAGCRRSARPVR